MTARRTSKRAPARRVLQIDEQDFREACARSFVSADVLLERVRRLAIEREMDRIRKRTDALLGQTAARNDGDHERVYEIFEEIERLERRWNELFAGLYGVTPTGDLPSAKHSQPKPTTGRAEP